MSQGTAISLRGQQAVKTPSPTPMSEQRHSAVDRVLSAYGFRVAPDAVQWLGGAGGFSGACFWRIAGPDGPLCLRQWPEDGPSASHLEFVHAVLDYASQQGFRLLPLPKRTTAGKSYVAIDGRFWELSPWLVGEADYRRAPSRVKLRNALQALARFHQATASFPSAGPNAAPSPGLTQRAARLRAWRSGGVDRLAEALRPDVWPELLDRAGRMLALFERWAGHIENLLDGGVGLAVPMQPCIRDVWGDHILFCGDEVSGIVDFGAMEIESVTGDLARLLGSLAGSDWNEWREGLDAYETVRPLSNDERRLLNVFDLSGLLLSGMNWLDWIYLGRREFSARGEVLARLDAITARLTLPSTFGSPLHARGPIC